MTYLKYRPEDLMSFLALMRRILRIFHFIGEFQERVFDVVEAFGWGFAVARGADGWHLCGSELLKILITVVLSAQEAIYCCVG
jgi:hypothetical protein